MNNFTTLKNLIQKDNPVQILGVINAMGALLAEKAGAKAIYLSGAGMANACFGLPDLALTGLKDLVEEVMRIKAISKLPLLVDIDTGFGSVLNVKKTALELYRAGASGLQIEDQPFAKRCGHLEGKKIVSITEMVGRIRAIREVLDSTQLTIVARTDALGIESQEQTLKRALAYQSAGADVLFLEAVTKIHYYQHFSQNLDMPILANSTEFGKTPLFDFSELKQAGVGAVLYPLSIFRVINKAAIESYQEILKTGSQKNLIPKMQTREELYALIDYRRQEEALEAFYTQIEQEQKNELK